MTYVDDRSPAFEPGEYDSVGLTKREYFAGMALIGLVFKSRFFLNAKDEQDQYEVIARGAYRYADAMLKVANEV